MLADSFILLFIKFYIFWSGSRSAIKYYTTYPWEHNCTDQASIFGRWNEGNCYLGAEQGLWNIALNGTNMHEPDFSVCKGYLSCEKRQHAWKSPHVFLEPPHSDSERLVVFLPGTGTPPAEVSALLSAASSAGNYVIGLSYYSMPIAVSQFNAWCLASDSPADCNYEAYDLMLRGEAVARSRGASKGLWNIDEHLSVASLLLAALKSAKWGSKFISLDDTGSEGVSWSKVIISGHSQGAGIAAFMSHKLRLAAVLFSGPQDCTNCSSNWLAGMSEQRDVTRRALFSEHEECGPEPLAPSSFCEANLLTRNLVKMGFRTPFSRWDGESDIQKLSNPVVVSRARPRCDSGRLYHNSVATNSCASDDIVPLWKALFTFDDEPPQLVM